MRPKPTTLSKEELQQLFDETQKRYRYPVCGYISVAQDGTYRVCRAPAGTGTHHPGAGKCIRHGGHGANPKHGLTVKYPAERVKTLFDQAKELHEQWVKDHMESVRVTNALLTAVTKVIEVDDLSKANPMQLEYVRRLLETKAKIDEQQLRRQERNLKTPDEVAILVGGILEIVDQEVKDVDLKRRIFYRVGEMREVIRSNTG